MLNRIKYVLINQRGASNVEIIVWISVVLGIATVLFLFRDAIKGFLEKAIEFVNNLQTS